jgi:hypothetical protein
VRVDPTGTPPGDADAAPTAAALEAAIAAITGVSSASVARGSDGRDRLRISLAPGEDPEAIAWTVAATLRERFGIALDPAAISARTTPGPTDAPEDQVRMISPSDPVPEGGAGGPPVTNVTAIGDVAPSTAVVTAAEPDAPDGGPSDDEAGTVRPLGDGGGPPGGAATQPPAAGTFGPPPHRLGNSMRRHRAAITELAARTRGDDLDVTATLCLLGRQAEGHARGLRTRRGRWRAVSEATLDALGRLSSARIRGHVDHVTVLDHTDLAHVSVSVTLLTDRGEETFLGAALVHGDLDRAVMRATLDAVNRRVEQWLEEAALETSEVG